MPPENYTISDYMSHHETRSRSDKQYKQTLLYVALMCVAAGLVTLYFDFKVITAVVLPIGALTFQSSSRYALLRKENWGQA